MAGPQREILYANERAVQTFEIETDRLPGGVNFRALHVSDESFERFGQLYGQLNARGTVRTEWRSEEHTSELQSQSNLVCRLLLEKKKKTTCTRRVLQRKHARQCHTPV